MTRIDFSHPRRMSPRALLITSAKMLSTTGWIVATFIGLRFLDKDSLQHPGVGLMLLYLVGLLALVCLISVLVYFSRKYYVKDGNLVFIQGLIRREEMSIPLDRIHSLRTKRGLLYRMLDVRGIVFDTLASRQAEVELVLNESEWRQLIESIENEEKPHCSSLTTPPEYDPVSTIAFPTKNLILAALCQNHFKGMAVLGSFFAFIFNNLSDFYYSIFASFDNYIETHYPYPDFWMELLILMAIAGGAYILSLVLWLGKVLVRYSDMQLKFNGRFLDFTYGLIARSSCRFLRNKICTIRIKRNILERRFGFSTIKLRQALNATAQKEEDNIRIYATDLSSFFLGWWLDKAYADEERFLVARSGRGVAMLFILPNLLLVIALCILFGCYNLYAWISLPLLYFAFVIPIGIMKMRRSRITLCSSYLIVEGGILAEVSNYLKYSNVEVVRIGRSPLTRWTGRVSVALSTSGSYFTVRSLKESEANLVYDFILSKVELRKGNTK